MTVLPQEARGLQEGLLELEIAYNTIDPPKILLYDRTEPIPPPLYRTIAIQHAGF